MTHEIYRADQDGRPQEDAGYDDDGRDGGRGDKVDQTVTAPDEVRSAFGGGGREKKEEDFGDDGYDDDDLGAREAVESIKNGDSRVADEYNLGTRDDRRRGVESYTVNRDGYAVTATKGGQRGQQGGPLIYIHCHQQPSSNRDYDDYHGRTRGQ